MQLPIFELEHALTAALRSHNRAILQAPTGSGKSTQVPQMLLDHGLLGAGEAVVLQPRRLATRMLAARVATERQSQLGGEVGYQFRFDRVVSDADQDSIRHRGGTAAAIAPGPEAREGLGHPL